MRHKYETRGIVLSRTPAGETNALITILTQDVGLVRARAQGVRRSGAKLAAALSTFSESSMVLVRGREGWRIAGAVLENNWFIQIHNPSARVRAGRVAGLLLRLVAGEEVDLVIFSITTDFFRALATFPEDIHEAVEILAVLRILAALGLDKGEIPKDFSKVLEKRTHYIARINNGIEASGL